mmetsp:Transcript_2647/g.4259  ORF Transcript_2647/g.4259 Transcript_2647/m.4259 type:complete len:181 (+) Transcript_2647:489-1031(+)
MGGKGWVHLRPLWGLLHPRIPEEPMSLNNDSPFFISDILLNSVLQCAQLIPKRCSNWLNAIRKAWTHENGGLKSNTWDNSQPLATVALQQKKWDSHRCLCQICQTGRRCCQDRPPESAGVTSVKSSAKLEGHASPGVGYHEVLLARILHTTVEVEAVAPQAFIPLGRHISQPDEVVGDVI